MEGQDETAPQPLAAAVADILQRMAGHLTVQLNGVERTLDGLGEQTTVAAFVAALGFRPDRVALEQNGDIVPRSTWAEALIRSGDHVELVHFVGGGVK